MNLPKAKPPEMLRVSDVARRTGFCSKTVRRWIDDKILRVHRLGSHLRISEEDLAAFLASRRG